jgi:hypothetical protein
MQALGLLCEGEFMNYELVLTLSTSAIIALFGWFIAHGFTSSRNLDNKRRELRTNYLLEAYRKLERSAEHKNPAESWSDMESAIADIQLLGSIEQVTLAKQFISEMVNNGKAKTQELLAELRASLRKELKLAPFNEEILHLRFGTQNKQQKNNE